MKIITFWWQNVHPKTLVLVDGKVVCHHHDGRVTPTGWRDAAQVRRDFVKQNISISYEWHSQCPRRRTPA